MSFTSGVAAVTASSPINLSSVSQLELSMASMSPVAKLDMAAIKTEAEAGLLGAHTAIKRHTIDAILGLPRLGGFPPGLQEAARASLAEAGDLGDRQGQLDVEGKIAQPLSLLITHFRHQASSVNSVLFKYLCPGWLNIESLDI